MSLFEDFSLLRGPELDQFFLHRGIPLLGIDEVGRGPLAGPVVCCAVQLNPDHALNGLNDSKKLSEKQRESLLPQIMKNALSVGVGMAFPQEIDAINILQATITAMKRAVFHTGLQRGTLLIDGLAFPLPGFDSVKLIKGDSKSPSIMAASIVAKVIRDRLMKYYHRQYPVYGFDRHKGYGTADHLQALNQFGASPLHRQSFAPVRNSNPNAN